MNFEVRVTVGPLPGIADPQGRTIERALLALGFSGVGSVRVGRVVSFHLEAEDAESARRRVDEMCTRLLANPVIERYEFEVSPLVAR